MVFEVLDFLIGGSDVDPVGCTDLIFFLTFKVLIEIISVILLTWIRIRIHSFLWIQIQLIRIHVTDGM